MRYTVVWEPPAQDHLARLWVQATDRQEVTDSANRIDRELRDDADKKGLPMEPFYILHDRPLSVLYAVDDGDCIVRVMQVKRN